MMQPKRRTKSEGTNPIQQFDEYLSILKRFGIPTSDSDTLEAIGPSPFILIFNTTLNKLRIYDGTIWKDAVPADLSNYYTKIEIDSLFTTQINGLKLEVNQLTSEVYLKDSDNNILSTINVGFLNNEGTSFVYNEIDNTLELYNDSNELLTSIPVSSFVTNSVSQIIFNITTPTILELLDSNNNVIDSVQLTISNVQGLQTALNNLEPLITILPVSKGGTGKNTITENSFYVGGPANTLTEKTIEEVFSMLISAGNGLGVNGPNNIYVISANSGRITVNPSGIDLAQVAVTPGTYYKVTVDEYGRVVGTSNVNISDFSTILNSIHSLVDNGFIVKNGSSTVSRIITGTSGRIVVSNQTGVDGNPQIDLSPVGVTPGTYNSVTVDDYGRVTAGTTINILSTVLSGFSLLVGGPVINTDTIISAFGKIQNQINNLVNDIIGLQIELDGKQDKLTETNFGQFMDVDLATKATPSVNDTLVGRDSLTNKAVEIPISIFKKKIESAGYADSILTGANAVIHLQPNGQSVYSFSNAGLTSIDGFGLNLITGNPSAEVPYPGKDILIYNNKAGNLTLKHDGSGTADVKFLLEGGVDLVIPPGGKVWLKYGPSYCELIFKSWINIDLSSKADLVGGKVPASQLPSYVDDVIEGYFNGTNFYTYPLFTDLITPESDKIYINLAVTPATQYRWSGSAYVEIGDSTSALTTQFIDSYSGTRLTPLDSSLNGFMVNKSINGSIGLRIINQDVVGNGSISAVVVGGTGSNTGQFSYHGPNYYVSDLRNTTVVYSNIGLNIMAVNNNSINFRTGANINAPTRFSISSTGVLNIAVAPNNGTSDDILIRNSNGDIESRSVESIIENKLDKIVQLTGVTLSSSGWTLNGGIYEYEYSNSGITSTSIVDIIPSIASTDIITEALIYPMTESSVGSVKLFAKNQPTSEITVTINIINN